MPRKTRRDLLAAIGASVTVGVAGCNTGSEGPTPADDDGTPTEAPMDTPMETPMGTPAETETETDMGMGTETETDTATETPGTANVRVAHFSPNAPNVDIYVDGDRVLSDVPFRTVSDYLELPAGTYTVTITAAGDPDTVPFEGDVTVEAADYTVAAIGTLGGDENSFRPLVLEDDNSTLDSDTARVRLVHAAPDAPAVDVTAGGTTLFDGAAFGDAATTAVPGGDYTLEVRGDTESNDGDVVAEFDVSLAGGSVYTAVASGYLTPDDEEGDAAFDLGIAEDASY
ncbi:MAG: DUF4397 domain-containing protein [Haloarculaceae archaeon]